MDSADIFLPKEPILGSRDMRRMKWLLYGPPGTGKSTFFQQAKQVLFLTTDGGHAFLESMNRPIDSWLTFKKYVKALQQEKPKHYKAICIDVADALLRMCIKSTCEKRNIQHQSDEAYGKAYEISTAEFETEIEKLVGLGYGLFIVTHSRDREKQTRFSKIVKTEPTLSNQGYKILYPMMDIVAYLGFDTAGGAEGEMGRRMYFQPTESMEAKDRTGLLPESLFIPKPEDGNAFEMVENFLVGGGKSKPRREEAQPKSKKKIIVRK